MANDPKDDGLCEAHRTFLIHHVAERLRRQEQVSERFLRNKDAPTMDLNRDFTFDRKYFGVLDYAFVLITVQRYKRLVN